MMQNMKTAMLNAARRIPIYRAIPVPKYRDYAAVMYFDATRKSSIAPYLIETGRLPQWRYSSMLVSAKNSFKYGHDDLAKKIATAMLSEYPDRNEARHILSNIASYTGDHDYAFRLAMDAWLISPRSEIAATKVIRLSHLSRSQAEADELTLTALRSFPKSSKVLWAACKHCFSSNQFDEIINWWVSTKPTRKQRAAAARPLAAAALRSRRLIDAIDIYAEACALELQGYGSGTQVKEKSLAGKRGMSVLRDLKEVLESANIPFFFAAGTALGIVRNGKPLDHDNDIDVGILEKNWNREELIRVFKAHPHFDLDDSNPESPKVGLIHRGGANIDLFKFYSEGDAVYHDAIFVRWKNSPFQIVEHVMATGDSVFLPSDVDKYLTENYGDWRTPNKNFDAFVEGPNVETTWPEYLLVHRIRRAYKQIRATNLVAAHHELLGMEEVLASTAGGSMLLKEMQL